MGERDLVEADVARRRPAAVTPLPPPTAHLEMQCTNAMPTTTTTTITKVKQMTANTRSKMAKKKKRGEGEGGKTTKGKAHKEMRKIFQSHLTSIHNARNGKKKDMK